MILAILRRINAWAAAKPQPRPLQQAAIHYFHKEG